jgi:hypothetical protein
MSGKNEKTEEEEGRETRLQQRKERRSSIMRTTYFKVKFHIFNLVIK